MATASRRPPEGITFESAIAVMTPVNAPTLMKLACPNESSPSTPTVRFSETAMTMYAQIGTSWPDMALEILPPETRV